MESSWEAILAFYANTNSYYHLQSLAITLAFSAFPPALAAYSGWESSNLGFRSSAVSLVQIHPSALDSLSGIPSCFSLPTWGRTLRCSSPLPSQDPVFPLGSDAGLSSEVLVHTCSSLQCTHHPPTPLHPVWGFLACSTLTLVICVGLFCFLRASVEATSLKKKFSLYTLFSLLVIKIKHVNKSTSNTEIVGWGLVVRWITHLTMDQKMPEIVQGNSRNHQCLSHSFLFDM